jgi:hypothetical protein
MTFCVKFHANQNKINIYVTCSFLGGGIPKLWKKKTFFKVTPHFDSSFDFVTFFHNF